MKYEPIPELTQEEITCLVSQEDISSITIGLLSAALHITDSDWCEKLCLKHLQHENDYVVSAALTGLSHIVRIHQTLNLGQLLPVLDQLEMQNRCGGQISDLLDDIEIFMNNDFTVND